jgi:ribonuclease J
MSLPLLDPIPTADEVLFLPLGGVGEIGMNLALYGHDGAWLMVDLGITFAGEAFPDYDVLMADPGFIERHRSRLVGLVLTHAHEDHVGALPYLWRRLRCPVYATPFTAAVATYKLAAAGIQGVPLNEVPLGARLAVGPFAVELIGLTHSIPEPNGVLIGTPTGAVYHTGDWKLDEDPRLGLPYDRARLQSLAGEPLMAMVCDSTNAVVEGHSGSEGSLRAGLREAVEGCTGRILVGAFSSNIARLATVARVAMDTGRRFGVLGPAMQRMLGFARQTGYWPQDLPEPVEPRHLALLPPQEVLATCTGSQGEPTAVLARLAADSHRDLMLDPGDTVIFSSRIIPGNEGAVERVQTRLRALGVHLITDHDHLVHVSGHPAREELEQLYRWVRPPVAIPVHGTPRHLAANATIAQGCGVDRQLHARNGDVCRLTRTGGEIGAEVIGRVPSGRLALREHGLEPVPAQILAAMREHGR